MDAEIQQQIGSSCFPINVLKKNIPKRLMENKTLFQLQFCHYVCHELELDANGSKRENYGKLQYQVVRKHI